MISLLLALAVVVLVVLVVYQGRVISVMKREAVARALEILRAQQESAFKTHRQATIADVDRVERAEVERARKASARARQAAS